jgi:hypothetical protein
MNTEMPLSCDGCAWLEYQDRRTPSYCGYEPGTLIKRTNFGLAAPCHRHTGITPQQTQLAVTFEHAIRRRCGDPT